MPYLGPDEEREGLNRKPYLGTEPLIPDFHDSFASRLHHVRMGKTEAMSQLVRLTTEEQALERILRS